MKYAKSKYIISVLIIYSLLLAVSCEKHSYNNPYDTETNIEDLAPHSIQIDSAHLFEKSFSWECDSDEVEIFIIDRKKDNSSWIENYASVNGDTFEWTDTLISLNADYNYRFTSQFDKNTAPSDVVDYKATIPAPSNLEIEEISESRYKLTWKDNSIGEQGFSIDKSIDGEWKENYAILEANTEQFTDSSLFTSRSLDLKYRLRAFYGDTYSGEKIISANADLSSPLGLVIDFKNLEQIQLRWVDRSDGEQGYKIDRKIGTNPWEEEIGITESNTATYVDENFELNQNIKYRVYAFSDDYISGKIENNVTTLITAPSEVELIPVSLSELEISWKDNTNREQGFKIDRKVDDGSWQTSYAQVGENITSYKDEVDLLNHNYSYRVYTYYNEQTSAKTEKSIDGLNIEIEMVLVEGGTFNMGCTSEQNNCDEDELPTHEVTLDNYFISKYEVTNSQYADFLNLIDCNSDGTYNDDDYGNVRYIEITDTECQIDYIDGEFKSAPGKENYPVIEVSWYGANAFARSNGGHLPTEAQWEYAARGGNQSQGYIYSGSSSLNDVGWYSINSDNHSHEVGIKQPNELGIHDMSGNVWEWCQDWYDDNYYEVSPQNNPQGPSVGSHKVIRGGSWAYLSHICRVANRNENNLNVTYNNYGFRIVREDDFPQ